MGADRLISPSDSVLCLDENSACYIPIGHKTLSDRDESVCRTTVSDPIRCCGSRQTDFAVGQHLVTDENSACYIPIRHNKLFDGDVRVFLSYDSV